jgi:tRNA A37 threonylcarbamoyladenosine biosynthesis protein TsaE
MDTRLQQLPAMKVQDESRLLWIKGDSGKGKTMMTMGVIAQLSRGDDMKPSPRTTKKMLANLKLKLKRDARSASTPYPLT